MQDIAGCRLIVSNVVEQDRIAGQIKELLRDVNIADRRKNPSHGYRAIHVIVVSGDKPIEIQARTSLQHLWAELSEKLSDVFDPSIKYGGGEEMFRRLLAESSKFIARVERDEKEMLNLREEVDSGKRKVTDVLQKLIALMEGKNGALPN
jgi:ppGpp synthetase/RelA/SpoT-type nucleotidyltranferase